MFVVSCSAWMNLCCYSMIYNVCIYSNRYLKQKEKPPAEKNQQEVEITIDLSVYKVNSVESVDSCRSRIKPAYIWRCDVERVALEQEYVRSSVADKVLDFSIDFSTSGFVESCAAFVEKSVNVCIREERTVSA